MQIYIIILRGGGGLANFFGGVNFEILVDQKGPLRDGTFGGVLGSPAPPVAVQRPRPYLAVAVCHF